MDTSLQRNPVYQQLHDLLKQSLREEYRGGDRFLSEREVSDRFDVSRATANKALSSLVSEGLLEFRRGIGTFVRPDLINYDVQSLVSFTEKAKAAGKEPSTTLLQFEKISSTEAPQDVQGSLETSASDSLIRMQRLRLANRTPVILEERFVVASVCPRLTRKQASGSLYKAWVEKHGIEIAGADEIIRAVSLATSEAKHLGVSVRAPALEVIAIGYAKSRVGGPFWWERTLYRGDQYEFHTRLGPVQAATPARGRLR
ncbi:MAG: GntR family transcriptional regulator [Planctomycetota bacterium]